MPATKAISQNFGWRIFYLFDKRWTVIVVGQRLRRKTGSNHCRCSRVRAKPELASPSQE